jgi:hypothetical protein
MPVHEIFRVDLLKYDLNNGCPEIKLKNLTFKKNNDLNDRELKQISSNFFKQNNKLARFIGKIFRSRKKNKLNIRAAS